ncbi:MAG TPA: aminopeptidase [Dongiaceae bacterium]|nr:aminopeptidase [Dongiaceae bacterium]
MKQAPKKPRPGPVFRLLAGVALAAVLTALCGCRTLSFYGQAVKGQCELLAQARPIQTLLADPQTPDRLKQRLRLLLSLRLFAEQKLKLPVDAQYQKYADVHRRFVVWNVEAAPEFSLQPKTWWYPLVGRLEYRGYFSETAAGRYGSWLQRKGSDVYVGGAQAYSTLGWFKDPVLNTYVFEPDADLAEVIFHELGHQRVFARGDTDFNEAFATTVGQEGARRWLRAQGVSAEYEVYRAELRRTAQFARLIMDTRAQLATLYGDEPNEWGKLKATDQKRQVPRQEMRRQKQRILEQLRAAYSGLKAEWGGDPEYDAWFSREINNAKLNSVAAYYDLVPGFQRLLEINGGDLDKFYQAAERLSKTPKRQRHRLLRLLAQEGLSLIPHGLTQDSAGYPARLVLAADQGQIQGGRAAASHAGELNLGKSQGRAVGAGEVGTERARGRQVDRLAGRSRVVN